MEDSFNLYYAANTVQLEQADWTVCDQNCRQDKGQLSFIFTVLKKTFSVSCISHAILNISEVTAGDYISPPIRQDNQSLS